jgi:hypothetical protein
MTGTKCLLPLLLQLFVTSVAAGVAVAASAAAVGHRPLQLRGFWRRA